LSNNPQVTKKATGFGSSRPSGEGPESGEQEGALGAGGEAGESCGRSGGVWDLSDEDLTESFTSVVFGGGEIIRAAICTL
jgi:hypothetical protein